MQTSTYQQAKISKHEHQAFPLNAHAHTAKNLLDFYTSDTKKLFQHLKLYCENGVAITI